MRNFGVGQSLFQMFHNILGSQKFVLARVCAFKVLYDTNFHISKDIKISSFVRKIVWLSLKIFRILKRVKIGKKKLLLIVSKLDEVLSLATFFQIESIKSYLEPIIQNYTSWKYAKTPGFMDLDEVRVKIWSGGLSFPLNSEIVSFLPMFLLWLWVKILHCFIHACIKNNILTNLLSRRF